jgi:NADPH2:quinone reductase
LVSKSLTFTRFHLGHVDFASDIWRRSVDEIVGGIMAGTLRVLIAETFPFDRAGAMLERLASRQVSGKLILAVNPV